MAIRAGILFFLILTIYILNAFLNPIPKRNIIEGQVTKYGTSYSFEQAKWYGINPREGFVKLISEIKFDWVRLPFFWDQMSDPSGNLQINDLRFAIEEADKRNIQVIVALGAKAPFYPEYHIPDTLKPKLRFGQTISADHPIAADILEIDKKVVKELSIYKNISHWQIENEPFLANVNGWKMDSDLLKAEVDVVRSADSLDRPIILNHVGPSFIDNKWKKLLPLLKPGDVLGVNAYFKTQGIYLYEGIIFGQSFKISWPRWFSWPVQSWMFLSPDFERIRKEIEARGMEFWVLEMQAEPYIRMLADASKNQPFYKSNDISKAQRYLVASGVKSIGFWGANFWQYRQKHGDSTWIDAVKLIVN